MSEGVGSSGDGASTFRFLLTGTSIAAIPAFSALAGRRKFLNFWRSFLFHES